MKIVKRTYLKPDLLIEGSNFLRGAQRRGFALRLQGQMAVHLGMGGSGEMGMVRRDSASGRWLRMGHDGRRRRSRRGRQIDCDR